MVATSRVGGTWRAGWTAPPPRWLDAWAETGQSCLAVEPKVAAAQPSFRPDVPYARVADDNYPVSLKTNRYSIPFTLWCRIRVGGSVPGMPA